MASGGVEYRTGCRLSLVNSVITKHYAYGDNENRNYDFTHNNLSPSFVFAMEGSQPEEGVDATASPIIPLNQPRFIGTEIDKFR